MTGEIYLDLRGLEPPEPMQRVLDALSCMKPGEKVRMLIDREPRPLYRVLEQNGYRYEAKPRDDYLFEILIWESA